MAYKDRNAFRWKSLNVLSHQSQCAAKEDWEVWSQAFSVKDQSGDHPVADRGSLNGGALGSLQSAVTRLLSLEGPRCHRGSLRPG